jgi:hypothetical protein
MACLGLPHLPARAVEPLQQFDVVLLQPGDVIDGRVDGGADALADYVRRIGNAATAAVKAHPSQIPSAGFIVVAARPAGKVRVWLDFKPPLMAQTSADLDLAVRDSAPLPVKTGDVVFALRVGLWGSREPATHAPAPVEWREEAARAGRKLDIDDLVDRTWPR